MKNISECLSSASAALMHTFTEDDLHAYVQRVLTRAREIDEFVGQEAIDAAQKEVNDYMLKDLLSQGDMALKRAAKADRIVKMIKDGKANAREVTVKRYGNLDFNVEAAQQFNTEKMYSNFYNTLSHEDVGFLQDKNNDLEIADHIDGTHESSNPQVKAIAESLKTYRDSRDSQMVLNGVLPLEHINVRQRWIRHLHNGDAMLKAGRDNLRAAFNPLKKVDNKNAMADWVDEVKKHFDLPQSFKNTEAVGLDGKLDTSKVDEMLGNMFKAITRDSYYEPEHIKLVKRLVLQPKSLRSVVEYNKKYGYGSLFNLINKDIKTSGNQLGIGKILGDKPTQTFKTIMEAQQEHDPKSSAWERSTRLAYREITSMDKTSVNPTQANLMANLRTMSSMARLPFLTVTALTDQAYLASFAQRWGDNYFSSYGKNIANMFNLIPAEERKLLAKQFQTNIHSHLGYIGRYAESENASELLKKVSNKYYKVILIEQYDNGNRISAMTNIAKRLYQDRHKGWEELNQYTRQQLEKFNLKDHEWEMLKKKSESGIFSMDNVNKLNKDEVKELWERGGKEQPLHEYHDELRMKVHSLFTVACENAVLHPGAFVRSFMYQGTKPGTWMGDLLRNTFQFKGFMLSFIDRVIYQGWKDMDGPAAKTMWVSLLVAGGLPLAYLAEMFRHLSMGKSMPDPSKMSSSEKIEYYASLANPHVWLANSGFAPRNQDKSLLMRTLFGSPTNDLIGNAAATVYSAAGLNPKKAAKQFYKTSAGILPLDTTPFLSPLLRQTMGQKAHLDPGQVQYYGK